MSARVSDVLSRAADRIEPVGAWGQGFGKARQGVDCAYTAIQREASQPTAALEFLAGHLGLGFRNAAVAIWSWNDAEDRTQPGVVAKLREAAAKAREQGL